jgi:hypothetical protein
MGVQRDLMASSIWSALRKGIGEDGATDSGAKKL